MSGEAPALFDALKQLGPFITVVVVLSGIIIRQLWVEMRELRKENKAIYEARVADAISNAQLVRETTTALTLAAETNRAVVSHISASKR